MNRRIDPEIKKARRKAYKARYYQLNKKKILKRNATYYSNNSEKVESQKWKYYLRYKFGIDPEQYSQMIEDQHNQCSICGYSPLDNARKTAKLYVDHNHTTGKIRGLLCMNCNAALGHFREDLTILKKAVNYLENYERKPCDNAASA